MEHEDGALVDIQAPEAALDQVPVCHGDLAVGHRRIGEAPRLSVDAPSPRAANLVMARADQEATKPCVEAIGLPKLRQISPRSNERILDGILCPIRIAEDEPGRGIELVDRRSRQGREGVVIAQPCPFDEISLHAVTAWGPTSIAVLAVWRSVCARRFPRFRGGRPLPAFAVDDLVERLTAALLRRPGEVVGIRGVAE